MFRAIILVTDVKWAKKEATPARQLPMRGVASKRTGSITSCCGGRYRGRCHDDRYDRSHDEVGALHVDERR